VNVYEGEVIEVKGAVGVIQLINSDKTYPYQLFRFRQVFMVHGVKRFAGKSHRILESPTVGDQVVFTIVRDLATGQDRVLKFTLKSEWDKY
jgi:hypothetical protein